MGKLAFVVLAVAVVAGTACKKKEPSPSPSTSPSTTTATTTSPSTQPSAAAPAPAHGDMPSKPGLGSKLDGKTFKIKMIEPGKPPDDDSLMFANGTFESMGCRKYGFTAVKYTVADDKDATRFMAMAKSPKEGMNHWMGKVVGERIEGSLEWSKPGQKMITYTFEGTLAK